MMMEELTSDRHEAGRTAQPEFMRLGLEKLDAFQDEIADLEAKANSEKDKIHSS